MPDTVNPQVTDSVTTVDTKVLGEIPAHIAHMVQQGAAHALNLSLQNSVAHQQQMNGILQAATTAGIDRLLHTQPIDAAALNKLLTGNDLGQQIVALLTAAGGGQQAVKAAQTTPPETGGA